MDQIPRQLAQIPYEDMEATKKDAIRRIQASESFLLIDIKQKPELGAPAGMTQVDVGVVVAQVHPDTIMEIAKILEHYAHRIPNGLQGFNN